MLYTWCGRIRFWDLSLRHFTCRAIYACETRKTRDMIAHQLHVFHRRGSQQDHATRGGDEGRHGATAKDNVTTRRGRMAGHILRLQWEIPVHTAMYLVPEDGRRKSGIPKKTWRSTLNEDVEEMGVSRHGVRRIANASERSPGAPRGTRGAKSKYVNHVESDIVVCTRVVSLPPAVTPPPLLELCRAWPAGPTVVTTWVQIPIRPHNPAAAVHCMHNLPSPIKYNGLTHTVLSTPAAGSMPIHIFNKVAVA